MKKSVLSFIAVILVVVVLGVSAITGLCIPGGFAMPSEDGQRVIIPSVFDSTNGIRRGLDLVGGSSITFEAALPDGYNMDNIGSDMDIVVDIMRTRLTSEGYTEAQVSKQGDNRVNIEIPQIKNPEEAVQLLGATAQLSFVDADGTVWLTGSDIEKATAEYAQLSQAALNPEHYIALQLKTDARATFAAATAMISAREDESTRYLAIMLDNTVISAPMVNEAINSDTCTISGSFTAESAASLANLINSGSLPFSLTQVELRAVGPQLGANALSSSVTAAMIGILLVAIFMILVYRLPGFVAVIALGFYIVIEAIVLSLLKVNLSLPGIAGIILSIGMAVDANVVIFERIKEELRNGKTVKASIDSGFKRAFTAILDSNVTTLIAAGVLFWKGTGTIVGFATTLGLGVIISMFTALTITHFLLNRMVDFRIKNPKAYGA